ncbi:MAG: zinc ribbon domain-containing protein [Prevotella sp.]|nr:zinc ribbon domain-containing protein [Prevotella sp.]
MAIIRCPECGHSISDKAPTCPNCGVEIAGKITVCPDCGNAYFKEDGACPHCKNHSSDIDEEENEQIIVSHDNHEDKDVSQSSPISEPDDTPEPPVNSGGNDKKKGKGKTVLIVSFIIAVIIVGVCFFFYNQAVSNKEESEYEYALNSSDPTILQSYLDNFKDAPEEHINIIREHLQKLSLEDVEWNDAVINGTKSALNNYLNKYPDTPHKQEILDKLDSIDWIQATNINTIEAFQSYVDNHYDGAHYDEAMLALKNIKSNEIKPADTQFVKTIFHNFFVAINSKDEGSLIADVSDNMTLLGKDNVSKNDVIAFMYKLYKPEIKSMLWTLTNDYDIQKKTVADGQFEYTVRFSAIQKVEGYDNKTTNNRYRIDANINADGKISDLEMTKIFE